MKRWLSCLLLMILFISFPSDALAAYEAQVVKSSVRVYQHADKSGATAKLKKGTVVTVSSEKDGMAKIRLNGHTGYVATSALKEKQKQTFTTVAVSGAKVYSSSGRSGKSKAISKGTKLEVLSVRGDWAKVKRNDKTGYIYKYALKLYGGTGNGEPKENKVDIVIKAAREKLGCPYVHATRGPDRFDCSGLVQYAFKKVGISLSGSARVMGYHSGGKRVMLGELRRGDIVVFDTVEDNDLSDHVGIYIGGGKFIHASSEKGKVMISPLSGFYRRKFSWGIRLL